MDPRRRALLVAAAAAAAPAIFKPPPALSALAQSRLMSKRVPASGEALPVIGLGTWQTFDVHGDSAPQREVLKLFADLGGRVVDSSPMYGAAEALLGGLSAELGLRERLFMATKVWTTGREEGVRQMEASFKRMRVERMDLLQVHNLVDVGTHAQTLKKWKDQGRVRYVGITHYTASAYVEVERELKREPYDFLQINYSLGEREAERRLLPLCLERKVAVIANRPFAEGALFRRARGKPLPAWAAELGIESWAQYFLKWIVSHPAVTCAIPATANPAHMRDNLGAARGALPDEAARRRMAEHFSGL